MNTRNWSIRSKIIALVAVPIAALLALWIFATTLTVGPATSLLAARTLLDEVGRPGGRLVAELQAERRLSLIQLASRSETGALARQRARTDQAVAEFRRHSAATDLGGVAGGLLAARIDQTLIALDTLASGRGSIDDRMIDRVGALDLYSDMIDSAFRAFATLSTLPDPELNRQARTLTTLGHAREVLARTDALLAGVLAADRFDEGEYAQFAQLVGATRMLYDVAVADLSDPDRAAYQQMTGGADFVALTAMQDRLLAEGRADRVPVSAGDWQRGYESVQHQLRDFEVARADALAEGTTPVATGILLRLGLAGVLGLLAIVVALLIAIRVGRSLVRRLTGLRAAALEMAGERLPAVVGRLRRGEEVDVAQEAPGLDYGTDEIGQLGQAFTEVQRSAVASAVDEAALRRGLNEVFLNIARRSQTLLHRQLALLDRIERRVEDPEELADLFRIDHLATRMRRHAEDLVILAGAAPGRGWRNPVSMIDVIRGAISEVEEYARVDITTVQPAATVGPAVGDVIHLLAELIENAASFSPPTARVRVGGQAVADGYAIEVEDRGLGMVEQELAEVNRRLADPPDFDPANSARLGLFVVAQLAARHGVQVRLRPSPYGGVTAVALIPERLVVAESDPLALATPGSAPRTEAGDRDRHGAVPAEPARSGPAGDGAAAPAGGTLPRRIRQRSAPGRPAKATTERPATRARRPTDEPSRRSPEEIRTLVSGLQAGTVRGRRAAAAGTGAVAPAAAADPVDCGKEA